MKYLNMKLEEALDRTPTKDEVVFHYVTALSIIAGCGYLVASHFM